MKKFIRCNSQDLVGSCEGTYKWTLSEETWHSFVFLLLSEKDFSEMRNEVYDNDVKLWKKINNN
jgi:hypothetical protein